ncbi:MAG: hypothetical protein JXM70_13020 [Pirellulales bacterium]|nr:hypothetical protein [Pirellulales bacterium]
MDKNMICHKLLLLADAATPVSAASEVSVMDILSCVGDIVVALVAIAGLIIAAMGLQTWRSQLKGQTEYNLARRLLRAALKTRDAISIVRNPVMTGGEIHEAMKAVRQVEDTPQSANKQPDEDAAVYNQRWRGVAEAMSDLNVESLEAEAIWGAQVVDAIKPLRDCVLKLGSTISRLLRDNARERKGRRRVLAAEDIEEIDRIIYGMSSDPNEDAFTGDVQTAIETLEKFVKPKLKL